MRKEYNTLDDTFSDIMGDVSNALRDLEESNKQKALSWFYMKLKASSCNRKWEVGESGFLNEKPKNWEDMFIKLCDAKVWDCLNFIFLKKIVDKYLHQSEEYEALKKKLDYYSEEVKVFMEKTKLIEFLDMYKELFPRWDDEMNHNLLKVKLLGNLGDIKLSEFHEIQGNLVSQLHLYPYVLRFCDANEGCIILYWYVPQYAVQHIKDICKELKPDFGQAGIIELCVDDYILYQVYLFIMKLFTCSVDI